MGADALVSGIFRILAIFTILKRGQNAHWKVRATAMEIDSSFVCPYCFQLNTIMIDVSAGRRQEYIEDCQVCCRPALLAIVVDPEHSEAEVTATTP